MLNLIKLFHYCKWTKVGEFRQPTDGITMHSTLNASKHKLSKQTHLCINIGSETRLSNLKRKSFTHSILLWGH